MPHKFITFAQNKNTMALKKIFPHLAALVIFLLISFAYYPSVFQGKVMKQHDYNTYQGMSKEIVEYRDSTNTEALWTNRMFGGMPAYLISVRYPNLKVFGFLNKIFYLFTPRPVQFLVLTLVLSYLAFLLFGINAWMSIIGAIAFAFSSYFLIIVEAGHITKIYAIAYMPIIVAAIYYTYKKNKWIGSIILAFMLAIQIMVNHLQITYYTMIIVIIMTIFIFVEYLKDKKIKEFIIRSGLIIIAVIFAAGANFPNLYLTYEYGKYSTRGKSELTIIDKEIKTSGLDKDYITQWSYGIGETFTLFIPNFMGGASIGELNEKSNTYNFLTKKIGYPKNEAKKIVKQMPTYWGQQPFTSGPVYVGAIFIFLFLMGFFIIKSNFRWWILIATILSVFLAWGKNFMWLTDLFIDYVPGYNKFRAVSMILVIAEFTIPLLGILTLQKIIEKNNKEKTLKTLKYSVITLGGLLLFVALFAGSIFSFEAITDEAYLKQGAVDFINALKEDRKEMLISDAWRSLIFILLAASAIFLYIKEKISKTNLLIFIGILTLIDLWAVDKRYVNSDDFERKSKMKEPYQLTPALSRILQDKTLNFRVLNLTVSPFNDASTSYFVNSIGGYHGAKMKRYQELIDFHISKNNMAVLNMLNTKYFIIPDKNTGQQIVQQNPNALGNAWFVKNFQIVSNADSEITALTNFNPATTAIVDKRFEKFIKNWEYKEDTTAYIKLISYAPNKLVYEYNSKHPQFVVFSEIYYPEGWNAYIDEKLTPHFRVNYVLRAMIVPAGKHKIVFKFEPWGYFVGNKIATVFTTLMFVFAAIIIFLLIKNKITFDNNNGQKDKKGITQ